MELIVQGVPIYLGQLAEAKVEDFITPFWEDVLGAYGDWKQAVAKTGQEPYAIQPYMMAVAKILGVVPNARYNADGWLRRYFEHFGVFHLAKYLPKDKDDLAAEKAAN